MLHERFAFQSLLSDSVSRPAHERSVLVDRSHSCPYPAIPEFVGRIQSFLRASAVEPGDCVTLELNNSVRAALTVLALLDAGASFTTTPAVGQGARGRGNTLEPPKFSRWIVSVSVAKPTGSLDETEPATFLSVQPNSGFDAAAAAPAENSPRLFFRTSGSMGTAKLAVYRYGNFCRNALSALAVRGFDASHRIALPTPIFHVYGLGAAFLAGLAGGASIDFQERSNIVLFLEREAAFHPNVAYVTPSFCEMLLRGRRAPRGYRFIVVSGDRISETTFRRTEELHGPVINQYGATELGVVAAGRLSMPFEQRCKTVGPPLDGVEVRVKPREGDDPGRGELQVRHPCGFDGYVDLEGRTLVPPNAFDEDWYRTGDLAEIGRDGALTVLGRCDLSVNRHGVLLPLAEVESRMREIPGVEEVAVAAGPENLRGRALVAFCVPSAGIKLTGASVRTEYAAAAPAYSVPEIVHIVDSLPKLPSGKVDRVSLGRLASESRSI